MRECLCDSNSNIVFELDCLVRECGIVKIDFDLKCKVGGNKNVNIKIYYCRVSLYGIVVFWGCF